MVLSRVDELSFPKCLVRDCGHKLAHALHHLLRTVPYKSSSLISFVLIINLSRQCVDTNPNAQNSFETISTRGGISWYFLQCFTNLHTSSQCFAFLSISCRLCVFVRHQRPAVEQIQFCIKPGQEYDEYGIQKCQAMSQDVTHLGSKQF